MCNTRDTSNFRLFGIPEDKTIQEPDEGKVLQRITCVLDKVTLKGGGNKNNQEVEAKKILCLTEM